ncbi:MAG: LPS-assembly protein LptD [Synergistaceae bacterium]|nr:LPS-assembly protein LptD [Synergistaceae bacterium]
MVKTFIKTLILALVLFLPLSVPVYSADFEDYYKDNPQHPPSSAPNAEDSQQPLAPQQVTLNADRVSFNDETGNALAEGNAVLKYNGTTINAERIEYNSDTQKVKAMPLPGEKVTLTNGNRAIKGDQIDYDLNSGEGILEGPASQLSVGDNGEILYVYGGEINVIPWELAQERGLVKGTPQDYMIQWRNVALTTCALDHPHYRLESKQIIFIPNRRVVAKKPRVYLGNTYLFTSPFDYVVQLKRRSLGYTLFPFFQKSEVRGSHGGITGTLGWETGSLSLGVSYGRSAGFEFMAEVEQELNEDFALRIGVEHSWDDVWKERIWRPYAVLMYDHNGWSAHLRWSSNEYISDKKDSFYRYKGRLDRQPEFIVWAPWFRNSKFSWTRVFATYGSYKETIYGWPDDGFDHRVGIGFRNYYEQPLGDVDLFANTEGVALAYSGGYDQEMLRSFIGLRYKIGVFDLGTAYERQYAWGDSTMLWDEYSNRRRIHQRVKFPVGREVYLAFRGSYDLFESMVDETLYSVQWDTDCMTWDLHYKNDRTWNGDDSIGLTIILKAFPSRAAAFGQKIEVDPFDRPLDIPGKDGKIKKESWYQLQ